MRVSRHKTGPPSGFVLPRIVHGSAAVLLLCSLLCGCDYARMKDDEAVNTYQTTMPTMDARTIPTGKEASLRKEANPEELRNPVPYTEASVERGKTVYGYYCVQCHGPDANGYGTVGQSFFPLPADLRAPMVQELSDGLLFYRMSVGYQRQPPLAYTVAPDDRWAVIHYIRSLVEPPQG